jgi:hypothetical protein
MDNQVYLPVVIVVLILFWLGFRKLIRGGQRMQVEQKARIARSEPARAKVLQIGKSVIQQKRGTVIVKLRLGVHRQNLEVIQLTTVWEIQQGALAQIQQGGWVEVRIDPDDARIIYPNEHWAEFSKLEWETWVRDRQKHEQ